MEYAPQILLLFFLIALLAALFDAIAGGGGLLLIPSLLLLGLAPATAIATNKIGACAGSFAATLYFARRGLIDFKASWRWVVATFIGAVLGGIILTRSDSGLLQTLIPFLLIGFAIFFICSPNIGLRDSRSILPLWLFTALVCPLLGLYDGFFGPGTGTFMALAFVLLLGRNLVNATAHAKLLNLTSNASSLLYFLFFGEIHWDLAGAMLLGQLLGGHLGARLAVNKGQRLIRVVMVVVSLAVSAKLLLS